MVAHYERPAEIGEALALLTEHGFDAKVVAGGQSLVPMMSAGLLAPEVLVDINGLPGLDQVEVADGDVHVGALVRHRDLERPSDVLRAAAPLLPLAAGLVGHVAIRNRGTLVGSLVHADPSGEWPAVALALDARVRLLRAAGQREVAAADFFDGPMTSVIEPEELAVEVRFSAAPPATGASVRELAYRDGDYAVVGVAAQVSVLGDGGISDARIALFGVDAVPIRATEAERVVAERGVGAFDDAAEAAREAASPSSDATASSEYRSNMIPVMCARALHEAHNRARHIRASE